jgi:hypothetical protein
LDAVYAQCRIFCGFCEALLIILGSSEYL